MIRITTDRIVYPLPDGRACSDLLCQRCCELLTVPYITDSCRHRYCFDCIQTTLADGIRIQRSSIRLPPSITLDDSDGTGSRGGADATIVSSAPHHKKEKECAHDDVSTRCVARDCNQGISLSQIRYDRETDALLKKIIIRCEHGKDGCPWKGPVQDYASVHLQKECIRRKSSCSWKCGRVDNADRIQIHEKSCPRHVKPCPHCSQPYPHDEVVDHISRTCALAPSTCPNGCGKSPYTLYRYQVVDHCARECPMEPVPCPIPGCNATSIRKDINDHVQSDAAKHLLLLASAFHRSLQEVEVLKKEVAQLRLLCAPTKPTDPMDAAVEE